MDIKVAVTDGTFHEVDSNELAFKMAGIFALKDAFKKAGPILLEPIMKVELHHAGRIPGRPAGRHQPPPRKSSTASRRRTGRPFSTREVPLAEMFGYATAIRSLSKGRASYSMEPFNFEQVPNRRRRRRFWTRRPSGRRRGHSSPG